MTMLDKDRKILDMIVLMIIHLTEGHTCGGDQLGQGLGPCAGKICNHLIGGKELMAICIHIIIHYNVRRFSITFATLLPNNSVTNW